MAEVHPSVQGTLTEVIKSVTVNLLLKVACFVNEVNKHTSMDKTLINYGRKKVYIIGPTLIPFQQ
jgi:hypothetical protein